MGTASNATPLDDQEEKVMCSEVFQTKEGVTSMQDFPCKNCQKRHTGCHGTCSEYLLAQTENARKRAYANAQKRISRDEAAVFWQSWHPPGTTKSIVSMIMITTTTQIQACEEGCVLSYFLYWARIILFLTRLIL